MEQFAQHTSTDAKGLAEDEETGAKRYRYVRTGEDHFSLALRLGELAGSECWTARLLGCREGLLLA
jgi:hypothetical protein